MSTIAEIAAAVEDLPKWEQQKLLQQLSQRLEIASQGKRRLPLVPPTGNPITQREIDDGLDAD
jgi:hypothetical protein